VVVGSPPPVIVVTGSGFGAGSVVSVNGSPRATVPQGPTQLAVSLVSGDVGSAGVLAVEVTVGGTVASNTLGFSVRNPLPSVSALSPPEATAGSASLLVSVAGGGFVPSTVVTVDGAPSPTNFISANSLTTVLAQPALVVSRVLSIGVSTPAPGGGAAAGLSLRLLAPVSAVLNVKTYGAVGSAFTTTGTIAEGSNSLQLAAPWDSGAGGGIQIMHAGLPITLNVPEQPSVTPVSDPLTTGGAAAALPAGSRLCSYSVAALDAHGGETAASAPTLAASAPVLGPREFQNEIRWYGVPGALGYAVYGDCDGSWGLVTIADLPQDSVFWTSRTAVQPGATLVPFAPNGFLYRADPTRFTSAAPIGAGISTVTPSSLVGIDTGQTYDVDWGTAEEEVVSVEAVDPIGGTFTARFSDDHPAGVSFYGMTGGTEPRWPSQPGGTVRDGAVSWTNTPFTAYDYGEPMVSAPTGDRFDVPVTVSPVPPAGSLSDTFVSAVVSAGSSSLVLTLAGRAGTRVEDTPVEHDDLAAIQAAFNAAAASSTIYQLYYGGPSAYSAPTLEFPAGQYPIDSSVMIGSPVLSVNGDVGAVLLQTTATQDVLHAEVWNGFHVNVDGMTFRGGRSSLWFGGPDVDSATIAIRGDTFLSSLGYAIYTVGLEAPQNQRPNDIHNSQEVVVSGSLAVGCSQWIFTTSDLNSLDNDWVEQTPPNVRMGGPIIGLRAGEMQINGGVYIPGLLPYGTHWVDDYGDAFYSEGARWSPEGDGGVPVLFDYQNEFGSDGGGLGGRNAGEGLAWDTVVSITDGELTGGSDGAGTLLGLVNCMTACPALLDITGNYYTAYYNVFLASPGVDLDTLFTASQLDLPSGFLTDREIHYSFDNNDASSMLNTEPAFPPQVLPYTQAPESGAVPASGNWSLGQSVLVESSGGVTGWIVTAEGKAAPGWGADTQYRSGEIRELGGGVYIAIRDGLSGSAEPQFSACVARGCTLKDGGVIWSYYGPAAQFAKEN
jgi:hypothetical protein